MSTPADYRFSKEHEWAKREGDLLRVGITQYAVDELNDVTLVSLPSVGLSLSVGTSFGEIESVKTVSELFSPVSGEVVEVNSALEEAPEAVSDDPYAGGWLVVIKMSDPSELDALMDAAAYDAYLSEIG